MADRSLLPPIPPAIVPQFSFCITCMDRLEHLSRTLPGNLDVANAADVEFVVLDYNSTDGLQSWVSNRLSEPLRTGRLVVYRTEQPKEYRSSHAKNAVHRLAAGEVLVNLDADQVLTADYVSFVRSNFGGGRACVLEGGSKSTVGRVALRREHFYGVGGYDEAMTGWGGDDLDLIQRASVACGLRRVWTPPRLTPCIPHDDGLRTRRMGQKNVHASNAANRHRTLESIRLGRLVANNGIEWGACDVRRILPD